MPSIRLYTCYSKANVLSSLEHNYVWVETCLFHWQLTSSMSSWNFSFSFIILDYSYNELCIVHNCLILDTYPLINLFEFAQKMNINVFCLFLSLFQFNLACVDTLLSMKKQSPNCLRRSEKDTSNLTLHFGMISLNQVFVSLGKSLLELCLQMSICRN